MGTRKGLTLIELLIVVVILGVLAALAIPRITTSAATAKANTCKTNQDVMDTQIELYYSDIGSYPTLSTITSDPNYFPSGLPTCPSGGAYTKGSNNRVTCNISGH
jgi:prepilin-type N-terminal cleavage/methylation domain-containing protein